MERKLYIYDSNCKLLEEKDIDWHAGDISGVGLRELVLCIYLTEQGTIIYHAVRPQEVQS